MHKLFFVVIPLHRIMPGLLKIIYSLWSLFLGFTFPERFTLEEKKTHLDTNFMILYFVTPYVLSLKWELLIASLWCSGQRGSCASLMFCISSYLQSLMQGNGAKQRKCLKENISDFACCYNEWWQLRGLL